MNELKRFLKGVENEFDVKMEVGEEVRFSDVKDSLIGCHDWIDAYILIGKSGLKVDVTSMEAASEPVRNAIMDFFGFKEGLENEL